MQVVHTGNGNKARYNTREFWQHIHKYTYTLTSLQQSFHAVM